MTCPCRHYGCPTCTAGESAPYFCRSNGSVMPEGWPDVGYKEKRMRKRDGVMVEVPVTVSAHDLVLKLLRDALKTERAEYMRERGEIIRRIERENREMALEQGVLF